MVQNLDEAWETTSLYSGSGRVSDAARETSGRARRLVENEWRTEHA